MVSKQIRGAVFSVTFGPLHDLLMCLVFKHPDLALKVDIFFFIPPFLLEEFSDGEVVLFFFLLIER